jgi:hypothetical protein
MARARDAVRHAEALSQMLAMQALRANPGAAFVGDPVRGVEVAR